MATAHRTSHRASLLNGLRTGGVRTTSMSGPHTAAPAGSFNLPRFASTSFPQSSLGEEDLDQVNRLFSQNLHLSNTNGFSATGPIPPSVYHKSSVVPAPQPASQRGLNPNSAPFSPAYSHVPEHVHAQSANAQRQAYQEMQWQLRMMCFQDAQMHDQQIQAAVLAEALGQRQHSLSTTNSPAGSQNATFNNCINSRRPSQAELLKAQLGLGGALHHETRLHTSSITFPTTPELPDSGFPSESPFLLKEPANVSFVEDTSLRTANRWRRMSAANPIGTPRTVSPRVKITPPPEEVRPRPLSFLSMVSRNPLVGVDSGHDDAISSASSASLSNPATPSSVPDMTSLSLREEATKKLYEGLGIGRPVPIIAPVSPPAPVRKLISQPIRQPRGPPSGADELDQKNFASRIRRKAIGGLNVLMDARERRESFEMY